MLRMAPHKALVYALTLACVGAALGGGSTPPGGVRAQDGEPIPAEAGLETALALGELYAEPSASLGSRVRTAIQVHSELESWNPYLTRFGEGDFRAWRVWTDEQLPWRIEDCDNPLGVVYARRGGPVEELLDGAGIYQRFAIEVQVAQVFLGIPWIEVLEARPLEAQITRGAVVHASRALGLMERGELRLAAADLTRALAGELPEHARAELERLKASCEREPREGPDRP